MPRPALLDAALRIALLPALLLWGSCSAPRSAEPAPLVPRASDFDVEHYALEIALDPAERRLEGACRVRLWPNVERLERVRLDLVDLEVRSVHDARGRELTWGHAGGELSIVLAEPIGRDRPVELVIRYGGIPRGGLWFVAEDGGVPTQAFTQGQPRDASRWFPCVDEPYERATSELSVLVPRAWTVIAAGERLERRESGDRALERWRTHFPHPAYLETLVAGELAVVEHTWDGIPLTYAAAPRFAGELDATFAETGAMLALFSRLTGVRYPYPKYAQTAVAGFPSSGMENLSATTLHETVVSDSIARADQPFTRLLAHEAAHQWFGDLATCADWSHVWLNEGFATYFAALYTEESRGNDAFLLEIDDTRGAWRARDAGANLRPMVHATCRDASELFKTGHVYEGAAARLHHLRCLLGDEAFFRGVRRYVGLARARSVVTDDLRTALEHASGRDLREHFASWFAGSGHPTVSLRWQHADGKLALALRQTQPGPTFPCLVEVEIADARGVRVERLELDERARELSVPQAEAPRWVRLDPRCALPGALDEERSLAAWLDLACAAPDAAGRRAAVRRLGQHLASTDAVGERAELVQGLAERCDAEPEAIVRVELVRALAPAVLETRSSRDARTELLARAARDPDGRARAAAFLALAAGEIDSELGDLARAELARTASRLASAAALRVLARADPGAALALCAAETRRASPHGEWSALVLAEIARLEDPERVRLLRAWACDPIAPVLARRAAIEALAPLATERADVRGDLVALLDAREPRLVRAAIQALASVRTHEVRARLVALAQATPRASERLAIQDALASGE